MRKLSKLIILSQLILFTILIQQIVKTESKTIYVSSNSVRSTFPCGNNETNACNTIQEGINRAEDGDEVLVANGTYSGQGNLAIQLDGKRISLTFVFFDLFLFIIFYYF